MKNFPKTLNILVITAIMLTLTIPLVFMNRQEDAVTYRENRPLARFPHFHKEDGFLGYNIDVGPEIENYLNDRIGFRDVFISMNAKIQYYLFSKMEDDNRYRLGTHGEFNIIEGDMVETFQHKNLFSDEYLNDLKGAFEHLCTYLSERNSDFYFVECWDKESIYPEYFPNSVRQYGSISRTDQFINTLENCSNLNVVSMKTEYLSLKDTYEIYSPYGDPVHWTPRGAYTGYTLIMNAINEDSDANVPTLSENDFNITMTEQGMEFYNGITHTNVSESFELKSKIAKKLENPSVKYPSFKDVQCLWYQNNNIDNGERVLIIGNSFIYNYIIEYFAESFSETMFIYSLDNNFTDLVEDYKPDIVIYEVAERYTYYETILDTIKQFP